MPTVSKLIKKSITAFFISLFIYTSLLLFQYFIHIQQIVTEQSVFITIELMLRSLHWIFALTVPMSVFSATLYSYSKQTQFTFHFKHLILPISIAVLLIFHNSQILPESNHRMAEILDAISKNVPIDSHSRTFRGDRELSLAGLDSVEYIAATTNQSKRAAQYNFEFHKKLAIPAAGIVFFILGAPLAWLYRSKKKLLWSIHFAVFAFYFTTLTYGENWSDALILNPAFASWFPNMVLLGIALLLILKARKESFSK